MRTQSSKLTLSLTFAAITALLASCATLPMSTLEPKGKNERLLPPLKPVIDIQSFGSVFGLATTEGTSSGLMYGNMMGGGMFGGMVGVNSSTSYSSVVLNDIYTIFGRDIENISVPVYSEKAKGTIIARLVTGENIKAHYWPLVFALFTGCIINLFGVPIDYATTSMQIEVTILNDKSEVVGKYVSNYHEQESYYALYWGYGPGPGGGF